MPDAIRSAPLALTGATGFVGRRLVPLLLAEGWPVRALVRRPAAAALPPEVELVPGSLDDQACLARLVEGAGAVIHLAGAIAAVDAKGFETANVAGTARLAEAAAATGRRPRFVQVSSLAAREPDLSDYARTKRAGEAAALAHADGLDLTIVRPPAVYGPGDRATLMLFRQLAKGVIFVPAVATARFSLIFVDDLARLLVRLAAGQGGPPTPVEPDDGRPRGYGWGELAAAAATATGRPVRTRAVPAGLLRLPAIAMELAGRLTGRPPLLSRGKLRELYHPDWVCRPAPREALAGWVPETGFETGCRVTLEWYKAQGWLPA